MSQWLILSHHDSLWYNTAQYHLYGIIAVQYFSLYLGGVGHHFVWQVWGQYFFVHHPTPAQWWFLYTITHPPNGCFCTPPTRWQFSYTAMHLPNGSFWTPSCTCPTAVFAHQRTPAQRQFSYTAMHLPNGAFPTKPWGGSVCCGSCYTLHWCYLDIWYYLCIFMVLLCKIQPASNWEHRDREATTRHALTRTLAPNLIVWAWTCTSNGVMCDAKEWVSKMGIEVGSGTVRWMRLGRGKKSLGS